MYCKSRFRTDNDNLEVCLRKMIGKEFNCYELQPNILDTNFIRDPLKPPYTICATRGFVDAKNCRYESDNLYIKVEHHLTPSGRVPKTKPLSLYFL